MFDELTQVLTDGQINLELDPQRGTAAQTDFVHAMYHVLLQKREID